MAPPHLAELGSVTDELGRYLNGLRNRALEVGQHAAFYSAVMSVLVLALREGCDDRLSDIDAEADRFAADLKSGVRQAIKFTIRLGNADERECLIWTGRGLLSLLVVIC